ncbi:hypothetical protein [Cupriavidus lacunae]|uniref:hypothetical protein n=1 Tax=Cupriavidus lacunae TaxID=2666307 RepID=UPI001058A9DA|nr:hypothetical protein [Cupriavidus lacunae]
MAKAPESLAKPYGSMVFAPTVCHGTAKILWLKNRQHAENVCAASLAFFAAFFLFLFDFKKKRRKKKVRSEKSACGGIGQNRGT